jgi:molybdopterin-containing oxidoreductase family iron-sulfur binding subunit
MSESMNDSTNGSMGGSMNESMNNSMGGSMSESARAAPLDLAALRKRLAAERGPHFWRSLAEFAETAEFEDYLRHEFPAGAEVWGEDPAGRRHFLKLMGASLALGGLAACTKQPEERILPFARTPEETIPGQALFFASAVTLGGYADGVLVESHMGRPTKIEGNPSHPSSLGATNSFGQAAVLSLYDPDRSQVVTNVGRISSWLAFVGELTRRLEAQKLNAGAGIRVLTETVTSPTLGAQLARLSEMYPQARWHQYDAAGRDAVRAGAQRAFGEAVETYYRLDRARVIVSLGADLLTQGPGSLRYAREFARGRKVEDTGGEMNRLYVVESTPTPTGASADHRLRLEPRLMEPFARALAAELRAATNGPAAEALPEPACAWIAPLAADLIAHRGRSVVAAGPEQPAAVHALAHAINAALGNLGETVVITEPVEARPVNQLDSLGELAADMEAGRVEMLIVFGGNPVYSAPADLEFASKLDRVPFRVHLSLDHDETSELCHWHVPETHSLEAWGDARAYDGTVSIIQPLILPLYAGKSALEMLAAVLGEPESQGYDIVRQHWSGRLGGGSFETLWRRALHEGTVPSTAAPPKTVRLRPDFDQPSPAAGEGLSIVFRPDPTIWDGCFANSGWLQELPKPITLLTWDNAALVSPATAEKLGVSNEDVVELRLGERSVEAPVWISPGHADNAVTVTLGYGRRRVGRVGQGTGFNASSIRSSDGFWQAAGLEVRKTPRKYQLVGVQDHYRMEGRDLIRRADVAAYREDPETMSHGHHVPPEDLTLYPGFEYNGYAWGLAIDLNACTGCNGCTAACQAENNIPVVGKDQVSRGREMHWLRVDRYYEGPLDEPETHHQPVMCMHCENAPCETVCPVGATVHSSEGLNDMIYNRCVGTRYCSNNCPYKVRRFNFLHYSDYDTPSLKMMRNPDVTVRSRGVMEKCTYCVQRINAARIDSEKQGRPIRDGEIVTACQQACPSEAIVFGNINDPQSKVSKMRASARHYGLLAEINTRPRTTYLGKLRNPNPAMPQTERTPEAAHG